MIGNFVKLASGVIVFGASATLSALAIAVTGLWLIGLIIGDQMVHIQTAAG